MNFHEVRFPTNLSLGSSGGPERRTEIVTLNSGHEERNTPWSQSRRRYDAGVALRTADDLEEVIAFFEARMGQVYGFRWKDWCDFKSCAPSQTPTYDNQEIFVGDSLVTDIQLVKSYRSGSSVHSRVITKPVEGTVSAGVAGAEVFEGTHFEVNYETGVLTFSEAPPEDAIVTAGFEFDVPARFASDSLDINMANFMAGSVPNVPIIEVRV